MNPNNLSKLIEIAQQSPMVQKHAALILYGKRIVAMDYNYGLFMHSDRLFLTNLIRERRASVSTSSTNQARKTCRREKGRFVLQDRHKQEEKFNHKFKESEALLNFLFNTC
jgi:hypothetical protein